MCILLRTVRTPFPQECFCLWHYSFSVYNSVLQLNHWFTDAVFNLQNFFTSVDIDNNFLRKLLLSVKPWPWHPGPRRVRSYAISNVRILTYFVATSYSRSTTQLKFLSLTPFITISCDSPSIMAFWLRPVERLTSASHTLRAKLSMVRFAHSRLSCSKSGT